MLRFQATARTINIGYKSEEQELSLADTAHAMIELYEPSLGLIIWTVTSFISVALMYLALRHLLQNDRFSSLEKGLFALCIFFIPVFGAIVYLKNERNKKF